LHEPHVFGRFKAAGKGSSAAEQRAAAVAYAAPRRHATSWWSDPWVSLD